MCTLAIFWKCSLKAPVIIAANRDEFYDRPTEAPLLLETSPRILGGRDKTAGGTWLGVNEWGVAAGILNRRGAAPDDPTRRSRGRLCLDALRHKSAAAGAAFLAEQPGANYNGFNLLIADSSRAFVIGNGQGHMQYVELEAGLHLLTNLDLNDMECPRLARSHALLDRLAASLDCLQIDTLLNQLKTTLSDHSTPVDPREPRISGSICIHSERFGTRSSTLLLYDSKTLRFRMWYADGAPCGTHFNEIAFPGSIPLDMEQRAR